MDRRNHLTKLLDEILTIFRGFMDGDIEYNCDNLHCAMKTDICEIFDEIVGDFAIKVDSCKEITNEELAKMHERLIEFSEDFGVKEIQTLIERIKLLINNG